MLDLKPLVDAIVREYPLPKFGVHGAGHWARVLENGLRLAEITGANVEVVRLFAIFHDARRVTEAADPTHGVRGAQFAEKLHGDLFRLSEDDFDLLFVACAGHMDRAVDDDPTVQTCWDADRLDVGRLGTAISPLWLGAATLENPKIMEWAERRANTQVIPDWMARDWGLKSRRPSKIAGADLGACSRRAK